MPAHSRGYGRLIEACARPGCPVCRCVRDDALRHLGGLIYEHVADVGVRKALRESAGFCGWHAALLAEVPDSAFGSAIIAADVLGGEVARVERALGALPTRPPRAGRLRRLIGRPGERPGRAPKPRAACLACASARESERQHLATMAESVGDARFERAFERSDGLCRPHVERLLDSGADRPGVAQLAARALAKWRVLLAALHGFVGKHDYRNREPITEAEARAWRLALELLAGAPGAAARAVSEGSPGPARRRASPPG